MGAEAFITQEPVRDASNAFITLEPVRDAHNAFITQEPVTDADNVTTGKSRMYAILVAGHATDYLRKLYGGLAGLFEQLLSDLEETWHIFRVVDGEFPSDENVRNYEGFVITGSRYDAHSNEPWVLQLCKLVQKLHFEKIKLLGICFGHQVIARALGGQTGRSEHGWEVGLRRVSVMNAFYNKLYAEASFPSSPVILEIHQDQVLELPPNGELLASTEKTSIWMYAVEDHILCIQGHPEFTEDIAMNILYVCLNENLMPEEVVSGARQSFIEAKADHEAFKQLCKAFLKATPSTNLPIEFGLELTD
ncbi:hypothetical protein GOP47_0013176 [Adiantum capillus-veneris]|uniref:Glutamine amidotransferase domain-containing protein n=1 Tax=Adiantum capillus-veneris TaxID=13818 RepID=A0A9D4UN91_ADICA|nr:hypothetical protein GOP47_0013176 [Adiantum capillus-veneris]